MSFKSKEPKDKAKVMRKILKAEFPDVRFSVRSDFNSIDVNWEDGPSMSSVERLGLKKMRGDRYEYINLNRRIRPVTFEKAEKTHATRHGIKLDALRRDFSKHSLVHQELYKTTLPNPPRKKKKARTGPRKFRVIALFGNNTKRTTYRTFKANSPAEAVAKAKADHKKYPDHIHAVYHTVRPRNWAAVEV